MTEPNRQSGENEERIIEIEIERLRPFKEHPFQVKDGRQRSWIREGTEDEGVNEPDKDGFTKLTKAEQLELPFDLPDREKG